MIARRRLLAVLLVLGLGAGCSSDGDGSAREGRPDSGEGADEGAGGADDVTDPAEPGTPPAETGPTSVFSGVTTTPPIPPAAFEIALTGAVTAKASGDVRTRCVQGSGFFDVEVAPDVPLRAGAVAVASVNFGAPGFRGPGRYDAGKADDAEWSVGLVDVENGAPSEFYSPLEGPSGSITIAPDGKSGRFEIRGLVSDEGGSLAATGTFACGKVER